MKSTVDLGQKTESLRFRPHHFLCAAAFEGKGYSPAFVDNFSRIMHELRQPQGDETVIDVVEETDSICGPCPSRRERLCTDQERITAIDQAHAKVLQLKAGDQVTWGEAKNLLAQQMSLEDFHQACEPCRWKAFGMCERTLKELQQSASLGNNA